IEGTGYINVSFLRDASSDEIFTAPLSYAVKPFSIDKSKRNIEISLDSQSVVRPGKPMDIVFSTSKASKIVIFAVDEGILQVANYATPNPLSHFMKKRSLGVETFQILDLLLPDFETIKRLSATGGGAEQLNRALAKNINPFSRKTDKPAVFWSGIYDAETHESKVSFDVPDTFAGELRIMAVAVSENAVGATRTSSIVRGPFVISPNLLTHAAPGDEFIVTVGVANIIEGSGKAAPVELVATVSEHLEIVGPSLVKLAIDEGGEKSHSFKVKANTKLGAALINFSVSHKQEQTSRSASLSIRPATNYFTSLTSGVRKDDAMQLPIERQLYTDLATQTLAVSKSPLVIVDGLHSYLETYPHGCTEQVVSKVFPLVGLMSHPAYSPHLKDVKAQFSVVIDKLRERQNSDGGFSFWPGASRSAGYPSIYAMHFLLDASEKGFPVPRSMLRRGQDFLETRASQKSRNLTSARDRANAIYLLTRMGVVTTNYLVDLEDDINRKNASEDRTAIDWQQDILSTYMAATYKMLQKDQEAERLLLKFDFDGEHQQTNDFRSKLAIDAQYLYLLAKHFDLQAKAFDLKKIHQLTDKVFKGEYNTISAAYSILALGAYSELVLSHDSKESITVNALKQKVEQALAVEFIPFATSTYPVGSEQLQVSGEGPLYYLNRQSGFNSNVSANVVRDGIEVYRSFVDEEGNEVTEIEQGKELTVKLKIRALNQTRLSNIAVIDLLPGGFEVIRSSLDRSIIRWHSDYIDVREDRVVFYGSFDKHVKEISYKVKVTTAGDFIVPPTYAESMYNQSIRAISKSSRFSVIDSE
ncbi:MAG: hypothetical protein KUG78_18985, partial [Kangiellaceae bacterium]|nr:hypothetical protein [Kangiellaceae bacterium]